MTPFYWLVLGVLVTWRNTPLLPTSRSIFPNDHARVANAAQSDSHGSRICKHEADGERRDYCEADMTIIQQFCIGGPEGFS